MVSSASTRKAKKAKKAEEAAEQARIASNCASGNAARARGASDMHATVLNMRVPHATRKRGH